MTIFRIRIDFHKDAALARAVKFAQENALPGAKHKLPSFNEYHLRRPGENGFHV